MDRSAGPSRLRGVRMGRGVGGESMQIIFDCTALDLYPMAKEGFSGGTELAVKKIASGLAAKGHIVHLVVNDVQAMEMRGPTLFYWPRNAHPTNADCVIMVHDLVNIEPYSADLLVLFSNGLGADLGPNGEFASGLDAVATFSNVHTELLCQAHPIKREICHVTGLGVELADYFQVDSTHPQIIEEESHGTFKRIRKVPGRMLYANDPQRGLWHVIEIFERVQKEIPDATLHISYDFDRSFENHRWGQSHLSEKLWECWEKINANPGITNLGAVSREQVIREQLECSLHLMPSDPPNVGSQIWGITQMECAAAGVPLILSDTEAFEECFGEAAEILPLVGWFDPRAERRWTVEDWADVAIEVLRDPVKWSDMSAKSRALAEKNTWSQCVDRWDDMLRELSSSSSRQILPSPIRETVDVST